MTIRVQREADGAQVVQVHVGKPDLSDEHDPAAWKDVLIAVKDERIMHVRPAADIQVGVRNGGVLLTIGGVTHGIPPGQVEAALPALRDAVREARKFAGP